MADWLFNLPIVWMALVIFAGTFLVAAFIHWIVMRLAVGERGKSFKALSPGMLPPLGIIFGLLVGFIAAQVWGDLERAKLAVANEASALRNVMLLARSFPADGNARLRTLINQHIDDAANREWPLMAKQQATLKEVPMHLVEALKVTFALSGLDDNQKMAQREIATGLERALDARRQRIILSQSTVTSVKWVALVLQALCTLIAIALVHSDNRLTCGIALTLFAIGIALSLFLIAAYRGPFSGEIAVGPDLLQQVIVEEGAAGAGG
jgi:hypothetical protein